MNKEEQDDKAFDEYLISRDESTYHGYLLCLAQVFFKAGRDSVSEKRLRFEVRRAESFYKDWKAIAEELMEQQAMPDRDLDSRISNLYQLEKEVAEGL